MSDPKFYLGKIGDEQFTLPSTTFLTHAAVLGASGSGKTVVCKSIVEEAIRAGIPIIAVDPKGDIGALGIGLADFEKETLLIHAEVEAEDRGEGDPEEIAEEWINLYKEKLEESFGDEYKAVEKDFSDKVAPILVTPKNAAGIQISLTPVFEKPSNYAKMMEESPDAVLSSLDLKIQLLLSRVGINTSSSTDNRVVYLNNIIRYFWEETKKKNVDLGTLIEAIQDAPFPKIGSLSVDKFISKPKRSELARNINALMVRAVPGVELDFNKLIGLATKKKKTPIIVFDLRKITDSDEKNTFVAEILGEIQRWAWSKGGTNRLRAILYFDELYGFMPAGSLSPPSKTALLILLKQARAAGLGCVLATQNPGDLDYRGLSNIATWILGRLATNQDIAKVQGALKPVFEGGGGTEEEFRKLMSQIRALKPGNFIAYNPRFGVKRIKTRWLLSLHKGPLTNGEISALTLKPPKPEKKVTKKEAAKPKVAEEEADVKKEIALINKKPSTGKITERFLSPRIDPKGKKLRKAILERLSITGNPKKDGFDLTINETSNFYSPLFFSKTEIEIKRAVKSGIIEFPVEIKEEMTRSFDLSQKIDWNSTTIEGIHASSLPPKDLTLSPVDDFKFHDIDKEIVTKLPDNLVWYFTQSPFPEAGNIYQKKLREYERSQLGKIAGKKKSKAFTKLLNDTSRIEEKIEVENQKLDETVKRIETLQGEMQAREAEGKSTRATERSIDSSENKMIKLEERKSDLRRQLQRAENKRQEMLKEHKEEYEEFHTAIEKMKANGPPRDLYRPGKADVKITEQAVYWIPHLLVPVTITRGDTVQNLMINMNIYNGNAEIACEGCGPKISTENYYQALLSDEISPPIFFCSDCLNLFCSEHVLFCSKCGKAACPDHTNECIVCNKSLCTACGIVDSKTQKVVCDEHGWKCVVCEKGYSERVPHKMGHVEQKPVCEDCQTGYLFECSECGQINSKSDNSVCDGCRKNICPNHLKVCRKCEANVCGECGRVKVKIKNEEVVARCTNCS